MTEYLTNRVVQVWALLVALTAVSWWLGADHGATGLGIGAGVATTVILVVAFAKVALIGTTFMELRHAARSLRILFFGLATLMCATLVGIYLAV